MELNNLKPAASSKRASKSPRALRVGSRHVDDNANAHLSFLSQTSVGNFQGPMVNS